MCAPFPALHAAGCTGAGQVPSEGAWAPHGLGVAQKRTGSQQVRRGTVSRVPSTPDPRLQWQGSWTLTHSPDCLGDLASLGASSTGRG